MIKGDSLGIDVGIEAVAFEFFLRSLNLYPFVLIVFFHLEILCLDHHAHTLHHLESLLTITLDRLDILKIQRISLTGFPAQSAGSSNTDVLELPCLLVLITRMSQSRQHDPSGSGWIIGLNPNLTTLGLQNRCENKMLLEFGDSYKAPQEEASSESSVKKKGRTVVITTEDMQKRRNDVKVRTTLLLALPDEHQLRFSKYET
nr:hypothetical protein [Tanacetum cinerariifolium]